MVLEIQDTGVIRTIERDRNLSIFFRGFCTLQSLVRLEKQLSGICTAKYGCIFLDFEELSLLDTAGAWLVMSYVHRWRSSGCEVSLGVLTSVQKILLDEVEQHCEGGSAFIQKPVSTQGLMHLILGRTGQFIYGFSADIMSLLNFLGLFVLAVGGLLKNPSRFRFTAFVHQLEHIGFRSIPIISLMAFLIGAILVHQGSLQLRRLGAEIFVIDLITLLSFRELGILITLIMFAGRSASACTAEIGAMKMREEIDAMRVIGLNPIDVLAVPRIFAFVIAAPAVTLIAGVMCLLGGGIVFESYVGIPGVIYLSHVQSLLSSEHIIIGVVKAPIIAFVIGMIACVEGLNVQNDTGSLGRRTTSSVVKGLFVIIVMDSIFALFFTFIGW